VKNPAVPAVRREAEEDWDDRTARLLSRGPRTIAIILLDDVVGSSEAATAPPRIPGGPRRGASIALGSAASGQRSGADGADPAIRSAENRATNGRRARDSCGIKNS